jgi:thiamine biosynthesis lipoprotein
VQANTWTTAAIVRGQSAIPWLREHGVTARLVSAGGDVVRVGGWPGERAA